MSSAMDSCKVQAPELDSSYDYNNDKSDSDEGEDGFDHHKTVTAKFSTILMRKSLWIKMHVYTTVAGNAYLCVWVSCAFPTVDNTSITSVEAKEQVPGTRYAHVLTNKNILLRAAIDCARQSRPNITIVDEFRESAPDAYDLPREIVALIAYMTSPTMGASYLETTRTGQVILRFRHVANTAGYARLASIAAHLASVCADHAWYQTTDWLGDKRYPSRCVVDILTNMHLFGLTTVVDTWQEEHYESVLPLLTLTGNSHLVVPRAEFVSKYATPG